MNSIIQQAVWPTAVHSGIKFLPHTFDLYLDVVKDLPHGCSLIRPGDSDGRITDPAFFLRRIMQDTLYCLARGSAYVYFSYNFSAAKKQAIMISEKLDEILDRHSGKERLMRVPRFLQDEAVFLGAADIKQNQRLRRLVYSAPNARRVYSLNRSASRGYFLVCVPQFRTVKWYQHFIGVSEKRFITEVIMFFVRYKKIYRDRIYY